MPLISSLEQRVLRSPIGISVMRQKALKREFHLVTDGTMSFLEVTSSSSSAATLERLVLLQRAEHLPSTLRYTALHSELEIHFSKSVVVIKFRVCEAQRK